MRNFILLIKILFLFSILTSDSLFSESKLPETAVLTLPKEKENRKWKQIAKIIDLDKRFIELIPTDQEITNWSEILVIQFFGGKDRNKKTVSTKQIAEQTRKTLFEKYPGSKISWNLLEQTESHYMYEWILHVPYVHIPPQHVIGLSLLTDKGIHNVIFNRRFKEMDQKERLKWIEIIKNHVSIKNIEEAAKDTESISIFSQTEYGASSSNMKNEIPFDGSNSCGQVPELLPHQGEIIGIVTSNNSLETNQKMFQEMANSIIENIQEKPLFIGFYLSPDEISLKEDLNVFMTYNYRPMQSILESLLTKVYEINSKLLWLHIIENESGSMLYRSIHAMTKEVKAIFKTNFLHLSLGPAGPIPKSYAFAYINTYPKKACSTSWCFSQNDYKKTMQDRIDDLRIKYGFYGKLPL